jgi:hypothetical protein
MNSQIKNRFLELKVVGQRCAISPEYKQKRDMQLIEYLKHVLEHNEVVEFEDVGFCYWNISDNYALQRDGHSQYKNHVNFYEHVKNHEPVYLFWTVCDATQRLTLEKDRYGDFWWSLYREAVQQNSDNRCFFPEFSAHRAALTSVPDLPHTNEHLAFARSAYEQFLRRAEGSEAYTFYLTIYLSLTAQVAPYDQSEQEHLCAELLDGLSAPDIERNVLVGEWSDITTHFCKRKRAAIGLNSVINALINCGELQPARELYLSARDKGLAKNYYIESRLS